VANFLQKGNKFSIGGEFAKNTFFLFFGSMVANVLNYGYHLVIGRQVSVSVYGEAESIISLIAIVSVPATTLAMVATKYAAACKADNNKKGSREIWLYLNKNIFKFGLPIFVLMVFLTPVIGNFLNIESNWALSVVWLVMYVSFFNAINNGLLSGWQKFKKSSISSMTFAVIRLLSGGVLVGAGLALGGIVGSMILAVVAVYVVTFFMLKINILKKTNDLETHCESKVDFQALKKFIIPVFFGNLAITILGNADMVLAKHNLDEFSAGQYGALFVVAKIIFFGTGVVASVLFSMSSEKNHKGDSSKNILQTALVLVLVASGCATLIYFINPALILSFLYGSKYASVAPYLGWFAIAVSLFSVANVIFQYLLSKHRTQVAYALLTIAIIMVLSIVVFGSSISAIIAIVIGFQALSVIICGFYTLRLKKKN